MGTLSFKYKRVRKETFSNLFSFSVLLLSFFILIGCSSDSGGGSSTTSDTDTTDTDTTDTGTGDGDTGTGDSDGGTGGGGSSLVVKTGYFVDSAVAGVDFVSGGQSGTTDAAGTFTYEEGKQLSLSVGGVSLGTTMPDENVTPVDLVSGGTSESDAVVNLARFLQTLDDDGDPTNGISIGETVKTELKAAATQVDFTVKPSEFEEKNAAVLTKVKAVPLSGGASRIVVSAASAKSHLQASITKLNLSVHASRYIATESDLPACNSLRVGHLYFVGADSKFRYCTSGSAWQKITFTTGALDWKGTLSSAPSSPQKGWAYLNTSNNKTYIYTGSEWDILASGGSSSSGGGGTNGLNSLVVTTTESAGSNCTYGGQKVQTGLDSDGDGTLQSSQIAKTVYICNGATGSTGATGSAGDNGNTGHKT